MEYFEINWIKITFWTMTETTNYRLYRILKQKKSKKDDFLILALIHKFINFLNKNP